MRRWIEAAVILAALCLMWYGAEMLLYGYSQPSIVKALVAVGIALSMSGRIEKELIWNDRKREFAEGILKGIQEGLKEKSDKAGNGDRAERY